MKLFISVDMEGISGVTDWDDVNRGTIDYQYYRQLMTKDVNAAIEGALEAGVSEVVVNDSHDTMRNLIIDELHPKAELVRGFLKPLLMMEGIDSTYSAAFFIGYHCMAGVGDAVLNHTMSNRAVQRIKLNGREIGEAGINAVIAGAYGVPVVLVTGDTQTTEEVSREIEGVHTVAVKKGLGMFTARCLHPEESRRRIKEMARVAVLDRQRVCPVPVLESYDLQIEFKTTSSAQVVSYMPQVELINGKTVRFQTSDVHQLMPTLLAMLLLGDVKEFS
ncbi:M55 family metallopeptidase [Ammoniphilus sp. CFH 90114]|uniref:M55 family metallopeptidase n=1 Tax=Ammoniphilus sp. CFH 90114 TaxID=2493665 RepID=UPI00100FB7C0|nr:M55 family metallopeptidase [Ammoniphilus sp. CFH 90114]RXT07905.1 aminopeptidase [Ammoniphilus sp. CFH 90114]